MWVTINLLQSAGFAALLWIRIRIHVAVLDPDPELYWECGSRGPRSMKIDKNLQISLFSCFCTFVGTFFDLLPTLTIFFM
jgi:hypothetical protein